MKIQHQLGKEKITMKILNQVTSVIRKISKTHISGVVAEATALFRVQGKKYLAVVFFVVLWMFIFGSESVNASGLALGKNNLIHGFDSITNAKQVETYITNLQLHLNQDRQLIVVSGTHGLCTTGAPDKSQGCGAISFRKEDYQLFDINDTSYVQVVDYHGITNWADFRNKHSNDYIVLAWCYSACWKGNSDVYKNNYCPQNHKLNRQVACIGPLPGTPENP
jgi:hypothetical protein